jgi:phosphoribosylanthranilate isomerase
MRAKICGITNLEDAIHAIDAGADALGFVFYEKSPRYITPKNARKIIDKLPPFVERVGLFVHCDASIVNRVYHDSHLSLAQIHFEASDAFYAALEVPFIKVIRAQSEAEVHMIDNQHYYLVDSYVQEYGGEGKRLNLSWFEGVDCSKMILAGGLNAQNVQETEKYGFFGVDVSSGVEKSKGKKDRMKVENFMKAVKRG